MNLRLLSTTDWDHFGDKPTRSKTVWFFVEILEIEEPEIDVDVMEDLDDFFFRRILDDTWLYESFFKEYNLYDFGDLPF